MSRRQGIARWARYAWAGPNSLLGLLAGMVIVVCGGRLRVVDGVVEVAWRPGRATRTPRRGTHFDAMTLGHVVLGRSDSALTALRSHEHAHVRQYERWGPFFLPAYAASSAWQWARGGNAHHDNHFERIARAECE